MKIPKLAAKSHNEALALVRTDRRLTLDFSEIAKAPAPAKRERAAEQIDLFAGARGAA